MQKIYRSLLDKTNQQIDFYKKWTVRPDIVGAIAPTSRVMAGKIADVIRPDVKLPILELGPGSGAITKQILARGIEPENLISVEYTKSFIPGLRERYPSVDFIHADAFNISEIAKARGIKQFDTIISSLPLLNFSLIQRLRLVKMMLKLLTPGRPMVQFSYGPFSPLPIKSKQYEVEFLDTVLYNLPPARIWAYSHSPGTPKQIVESFIHKAGIKAA